ncbi:MAG TPA: S41 family peptidase [Chitinophaga sp.]|uniref:S41 family peptidase n=1 Tax=Chitinophaga sp. TaxID=1869181 RepID=UPI002BE3BCF3|nr:S41 family peptidase [Chitinophaga sp.]HVI45996.1 S41 family peptidase [Chitinophaga sp.]
MKYLMLLFLCGLWLTGNCQHCACADNFQSMVAKVEQNYVGYGDKVTPSNKVAFTHFTDSLRQVAARAEWQDCFFVLRAWLRFFKDLHMSLSIDKSNDYSHDSIRTIFSRVERSPINKMQGFLEYLEKNREKLDSVEGLWEDESQSTTLGVMRDPRKRDEFTGIVLKADSVLWMPGQIKLRIKKNGGKYELMYFFNNRDHDRSEYATLALNKRMLNLGIGGIWNKMQMNGQVWEEMTPHFIPTFRVLDNNTCVLAIPSFRLQAKPIIDSLVETNMDVIKKSRNFIIDLRNNLGGSVLSFEALLPIIYTGPVITKGASVLATEANIREYYSITDYPNISDSMKAVFRNELKELKAHQGGMYNLWRDDTLVMKEVMPSPARVSVIVNENCASSAELFLLKARQSSKVKIYGSHSMGAVDYADVTTTSMDCDFYKLRYPTSRTNRLPEEPIDNIGIQPNIKIPGNIVDWVEFVRTAAVTDYNNNQKRSLSK